MIKWVNKQKQAEEETRCVIFFLLKRAGQATKATGPAGGVVCSAYWGLMNIAVLKDQDRNLGGLLGN